MRRAETIAVLALAACGGHVANTRGHLTLGADMDQAVIIGHAMEVQFGWLGDCENPEAWDPHSGNLDMMSRFTCPVGEASLYLTCSIACEAKGPTTTTETGKLVVWPKQLGELIITATVSRVATGERKTSHLAVEVVQPRFLLCPAGRAPADPLSGPGAGCTDRSSVTVDAAQPRARIRMAITPKDDPRRILNMQVSRELRANGQPLPPPHVLDLRTLFPERIRGAAMEPGDYPIELALGPQRETVTFVVEAP